MSSEEDARENVVCPHVNRLDQNPPVLCGNVWDSAGEVVRKMNVWDPSYFCSMCVCVLLSLRTC